VKNIFVDLVNLITAHLGTNPNKGGIPPKDKSKTIINERNNKFLPRKDLKA
jgi:hypothetical protein